MAGQGSLNKVMLIGNVGTEVKPHYFEGGGSVANFSIATNESYVNKSTNQKVVNTEWHNVVVYNKLAEIFEKYVKVGDKLYLEGRLRTRKWQDDKGQDRYTTEIIVTEFTFLPRGEKQEQTSEAHNPQENIQQKPKQNQGETPDFNEEEEDDLPF